MQIIIVDGQKVPQPNSDHLQSKVGYNGAEMTEYLTCRSKMEIESVWQVRLG